MTVNNSFTLAATFGCATVDFIQDAHRLVARGPIKLTVQNTYFEAADPIWDALRQSAKLAEAAGQPWDLHFLHLSPSALIPLAMHSLELDYAERGQVSPPPERKTVYRIAGEGKFLGPNSRQELVEGVAGVVKRAGSSIREFVSLASFVKERSGRQGTVTGSFAWGRSKLPFVNLDGVGMIAGTYLSVRSSELGAARLLLPQEEECQALLDDCARQLRIGQASEPISAVPENWEEQAIKRVLQHIQPESDFIQPKPLLLPPGYTNY